MNDEPADWLADVTYWGGRYEDDAHAQFGGERIAQYGVDGPHGWLDLPLAEAAARAAELTAWARAVLLDVQRVKQGLDVHTVTACGSRQVRVFAPASRLIMTWDIAQ